MMVRLWHVLFYPLIFVECWRCLAVIVAAIRAAAATDAVIATVASVSSSRIFFHRHFPSSTVFFLSFVLSFFLRIRLFLLLRSLVSILILFIVFVAKHQANFSMCLFYTTHSLLIIVIIKQHRTIEPMSRIHVPYILSA